MQKVKSYVDDYYHSPDHEAAARILEKCKDKPIRKMGPMDYSLGKVKPDKIYKAKKTKKQENDEARSSLSKKCVDLLNQRGAMTTSQLARELNSSYAAVSAALSEIPRVMREQGKSNRKNARGSYSLCTLWMMPVQK